MFRPRRWALKNLILAGASATIMAGVWVLFAKVHQSTLTDYRRNVRPVIDPQTGNLYAGIIFNGCCLDPGALIP